MTFDCLEPLWTVCYRLIHLHTLVCGIFASWVNHNSLPGAVAMRVQIHCNASLDCTVITQGSIVWRGMFGHRKTQVPSHEKCQHDLLLPIYKLL